MNNKNEKNYFTLNCPLPNSYELEVKLLSKIINNNDIMQEVLTKVKFSDFYNTKHRKIFYAMCLLHQEQAVIDPVTIAHKLGSSIAEIGPSYITDIVMNDFYKDGFDYIADKIKELSNRREAVRGLLVSASKMMNIETNLSENIESINDLTNDMLKNSNKGNHALDMEQLIEKTKDRIEEKLLNGKEFSGRQCGITDLDKAMGGFEDELIIIGARPSMGKTTLTVNILRGLAVNYQCLFFSMEQKDTQLITKLLSQETNIDNRRIDSGNLASSEVTEVYNKMDKLKDLKLSVDERAGIGISEIESAIIKAKQTTGLDVVCIDYLQYMDLGKSDDENRAFTRIVKQLKNLTKQYNICIILLSQLSRACEARTDKRPMMSDLRSSGSIEQEADKVLLLYRDVYYNPQTEHKDILEVNLAKNRNGAVNSCIPLYFNLERQLITSLQNEDKVEYIKSKGGVSTKKKKDKNAEKKEKIKKEYEKVVKEPTEEELKLQEEIENIPF